MRLATRALHRAVRGKREVIGTRNYEVPGVRKGCGEAWTTTEYKIVLAADHANGSRHLS